jgi:hypothetical protein
MSAQQQGPDVCAQIACLESVLGAPLTNGFEALSQLGDALTQCLNHEGHVPPMSRYECQRPRWALVKRLHTGINERGTRALWELGATGFRESRDRDLVTEVVNVLMQLANWNVFPGGQIEGPADLVRLHAEHQSEQGFQAYFRLYRDVWLPLRARFNALADTVAGALGLQHDDEERDTHARKKATGRKPGNPNNRLPRAQKTQYKKWLQLWNKAKGRQTREEFIATFPPSERETVRKGIRTAQKWESEKVKNGTRR